MLFAVAGRSHSWLSTEQRPYEWEDLEAAGRKVAGVVTERRFQGSSAESRFGVILGRSTSREDLDPSLLDVNAVLDLRWLSLYGTGGSLTYMEHLDELLAFAQLKPAVVAFAINLHMLVGLPTRTEPISVNPTKVASDIREGKWSNAAADSKALLKSKSWILTYRPYLNRQYRRTIFRTRMQLFAWSGLGIESLFPADPDPWTVRLAGYPFHGSAEYVEQHWERAAGYGWYDPKRYAWPNPQTDSLVRQIDDWQRRGAQVFIILLPEPTPVRKKIPPQAKATLRAVLQENFADQAPPVIDLRDTISDEMFSDHIHLNANGRKAFSLLLAKQLRALVAEKTAGFSPASSTTRKTLDASAGS
jgi:hypothetical protein